MCQGGRWRRQGGGGEPGKRALPPRVGGGEKRGRGRRRNSRKYCRFGVIDMNFA